MKLTKLKQQTLIIIYTATIIITTTNSNSSGRTLVTRTLLPLYHLLHFLVIPTVIVDFHYGSVVGYFSSWLLQCSQSS